MSRIKRAWLFTLVLLPIAIVAGIFMVQYTAGLVDPAALAQACEQVGGEWVFTLISIAQVILYAVVFGFFGYILADKIGLIRTFRLKKEYLLRVVLISLGMGAVFSLDAWTFAKWIPQLHGSYEATGSFDLSVWIVSVLYGGVIEEVMMRLFMMSLLAFLMWKIFAKKEKNAPTWAIITANVLAALLFAAGHLPATITTFGTLTPMLLLRCFLLNGAFGLMFGRFYRKYGIQYAILCHIILHLVSRTIWLIAF